MFAQDENYYVVKFPNNPQGTRILANELLGSWLARLLGLPVPPVAVIHVSEEMIRTKGLSVELPRGRRLCQAGLCFGSIYRADADCFFSGMPTENVKNRSDLLGMLVFDKWTGNIDHRQVIVVSNGSRRRRWFMMIDQGFCFGDQEWEFHDGALQGIGRFHEMYRHVVGLEDFEPWLSRVEQEISLEMLREASHLVPPEWYQHDQSALQRLIWQLNQRRTIVRGLLSSSLRSLPHIFSNVSFRPARSACA
jgi:hypothetical protein